MSFKKTLGDFLFETTYEDDKLEMSLTCFEREEKYSAHFTTDTLEKKAAILFYDTENLYAFLQEPDKPILFDENRKVLLLEGTFLFSEIEVE